MDLEIEGFVVVSHEDVSADTMDPNYLGEISTFVDSIGENLWPVNKKIHDHPELGYKEYLAHKTLTEFMKSQPGWKVTPKAYGLDTAWVAVFENGSKGPVVSFNVEMDALPGIGHACGHNLIASASIAGGLASAHIMKKHGIPGKIVLFGTPAEEGGGGKIKLLERGAYKDHEVDISLISHPGNTKNSAMVRTTAYESFKVEYFGKEAHAAASPWLGINALDALITAYNALSVLRQQTMPGDIIQGYITDGGVAPNIIHAYAAGTFVARANTQARLKTLKEKVDACFLAGASATGAELKMTPIGKYADHVPNKVLAASYTSYFNALSPPKKIPVNPEMDEINSASKASTDQGDISYAMPSISAGFLIPLGPEGRGPHSPEFEGASGTKEAFQCCLRVAKALAGTSLDVLTKDGMLERVKTQWRRDMRDHQSLTEKNVMSDVFN